MSKRRLKTIVLIAVVIYIIWKFLSGMIGGQDSDAPKHLVDRPWVNRMPNDPKDKVHALVLIDVRGRHFGQTMDGSIYRHMVDVLDWSIKGKELTIKSLQDETKKKYDVRVWECKGEAPEPFNLCLELKSTLHTEKLYSMKDWRRGEDGESLQEMVERLPAQE